jgi:hypothetical protein
LLVINEVPQAEFLSHRRVHDVDGLEPVIMDDDVDDDDEEEE